MNVLRTGMNMSISRISVSGYGTTEASPEDSLASYPGPLLRQSYPSVEMQSVYCAALSDLAITCMYVNDIALVAITSNSTRCTISAN